MSSTSIQRPIKIFCRIKPNFGPPAPFEISENSGNESEDVLHLTVKHLSDEYVNNKPEQYNFRFSKVFREEACQKMVFDELAKPVVDSAMLGYNGTIFAYGQTNSGKTYSMIGKKDRFEERGIIPRTLSYIFEKFNEDPEGKIKGAFISYMEIYNESGYDLLNTSALPGRLEDLERVNLLEDGNSRLHLKNLSVHPINSEEEALQLLYLGDHNRTIAETPQNEASTRSHCIFTIHLNTREANSSIVRRSKIHLVDLAGSERVANKNMSNGQLFAETRHINLALHYLEQVIVALADTNRQHVPYRNSMMTSMLRDSLGGNCMTTMIATLSLDVKNLMESLSTCRFSQRVALVTNAAEPNVETDPSLVITQLKLEIKKLREIVTMSSVQPLNEISEPVTNEEFTDCVRLVDSFLNNIDSNAILPVVPDMRLIQCCFQLIKRASKTSSKSITRITPTLNTPKNASYLSQTQLPSNKDDLLKTITLRDQEIKVLGDLLRKEKHKRSTHCADSMANLDETSSNASATNSFTSKLLLRSMTNILQTSIKNLKDEDIIGYEFESEAKKRVFQKFKVKYFGSVVLNEQRELLAIKQQEVLALKEVIRKAKASVEATKKIAGDNDGYKGYEGGETNPDLYETLQRGEKAIASKCEKLRIAEEKIEDNFGLIKTMTKKMFDDFELFWKENKMIDSSIDIDEMAASEEISKHEVETNSKSEMGDGELIDKRLTKSACSSINPNINKSKLDSILNDILQIPTETIPLQKPKGKTRALYETEDEGSDEIQIPLTGEGEIDKEIIDFLNTRKKVFKTLREQQKSTVH